MAHSGRLRIAVLMGGPSPEHDVSLASGRHVVRRLPRDEFDIVPVEIDHEGNWYAYDYEAYIPQTDPEVEPERLPPLPEPILRGVEAVLRCEPPLDLAFIAMHGPYGEDGTVQAILEAFNVPYSGSGVLASAMAMSKTVAKTVLDASGVTTPEWQEIRRAQWNPELAESILDSLGAPVMVKADTSGSSIGVFLCEDAEELIEAVESCFELGPVVVVEEYLQGVELTVPVAGDAVWGEVTPLAVTEIVPAGEFFDYESKYNDPDTQEITPARVPDVILQAARAAAARAHYVLGCAGLTRSDLIWVAEREMEDGAPYVAVLEVNTIPGMTPASIIPRAVEATGGDFTDLLRRLIEEALSHQEQVDA